MFTLKRLARKSCSNKKILIFIVRQRNEKANSCCKKHYEKFESNKKEKDKTKSKKSCTKSNLIYNNYFIFYKYRNINDFVAKRSPDSKLNYLKDLEDKLEVFYYDTADIRSTKADQIEDLQK